MHGDGVWMAMICGYKGLEARTRVRGGAGASDADLSIQQGSRSLHGELMQSQEARACSLLAYLLDNPPQNPAHQPLLCVWDGGGEIKGYSSEQRRDYQLLRSLTDSLPR